MINVIQYVNVDIVINAVFLSIWMFLKVMPSFYVNSLRADPRVIQGKARNEIELLRVIQTNPHRIQINQERCSWVLSFRNAVL